MSGIPGTAVVQVTNLSSAVSSEQMRTLFGFLGDIEELRLYPPDNAPLSFSSKVCYIKYRDPSSVGVAQHLTNTVFVDRALIVVPCAEGKIPEEAKALSLLAPATPAPSLIPGAGLLPIPAPAPAPLQNLNLPIVSRVAASLDSAASALSQPPLMGNVDPSKVDEIRRTVYVGNLNSQTTTADQLLEFFKQVGEVKFVRMAGDETQPTRFAFVEFVEQDSVARALTFNGVMFGDRPLKVKKDKRRERSRDRKDRKDRSTSRKRSRKDEDRIKSKARPLKVQIDREDKEAHESEREDSATPSEDLAPSPRAQHNGSYKTHREKDRQGFSLNLVIKFSTQLTVRKEVYFLYLCPPQTVGTCFKPPPLQICNPISHFLPRIPAYISRNSTSPDDQDGSGPVFLRTDNSNDTYSSYVLTAPNDVTTRMGGREVAKASD
ncbi:hypothetical protein F2P81_016274 [Scophthalmus maximus]|uniref:Splicing regulatory glutamine/lysine-rich protein 1 n=1 Tax=Scophthalmus maximus TaxID=52904 RepID=A0A6A4SGT4_SCOMX|nr:hypothetical protein F2P81_016274 [Scophthalmus maximus]